MKGKKEFNSPRKQNKIINAPRTDGWQQIEEMVVVVA